jgi:hypothetical protein
MWAKNRVELYMIHLSFLIFIMIVIVILLILYINKPDTLKPKKSRNVVHHLSQNTDNLDLVDYEITGNRKLNCDCGVVPNIHMGIVGCSHCGKYQEGLWTSTTKYLEGNRDETFYVTVVNGVFYINGIQQPELTLRRGHTYFFELPTDECSFYLSSNNDYNVTKEECQYAPTSHNKLCDKVDIFSFRHGVEDNSIVYGQIIFNVQRDFGYKVIYYNGDKPNMGGKINITD